MSFPAFVAPVGLGRRALGVVRQTAPRRLRYAPARPARVRMIGPMLPDFGSSKFFKSEIIQKEVARLQEDHRILGELGTRYKSFDREGKLKYITSSLEMLDRWAILLQRFKLSEEFQCQMYVRQLETQLQTVGMSSTMLIENTRVSLDMMRREAERE